MVEWLSPGWLGIATFLVVATCLVQRLREGRDSQIPGIFLQKLVQLLLQKVLDDRNYFWLAYLRTVFVRSPPKNHRCLDFSPPPLVLASGGGGGSAKSTDRGGASRATRSGSYIADVETHYFLKEASELGS